MKSKVDMNRDMKEWENSRELENYVKKRLK